MTAVLPPDPYLVLNVPKDADLATIRSAHRKLVIKCHPDKVQDPALKLIKADEFHKVQQAYELLTDEIKRAEYERLLKLQKPKQELGRASSGPSPRTSRPPPPYKEYDVKEATPRRDTFKSDVREETYRSYTTTTPVSSVDDDIYVFPEDIRSASRKSPRYSESQRTKRTSSPTRRHKDSRDSVDEQKRERKAAEDFLKATREKKRVREAKERAADRKSKDEKHSRKPYIVELTSDDDDPSYFTTKPVRNRRDEEDRAEADRAERRRHKKLADDLIDPVVDIATRKVKGLAMSAAAYMASSKSRKSNEALQDHDRPLAPRRSATERTHTPKKYVSEQSADHLTDREPPRQARHASEHINEINSSRRDRLREHDLPVRESRDRGGSYESPRANNNARSARPSMPQYASSPGGLEGMLPGREESLRFRTTPIKEGYFEDIPGLARASTYTSGDRMRPSRMPSSRVHEYKLESDTESDHPTYSARSPQSPPPLKRRDSAIRQTSYRATAAGVKSASTRYETSERTDQDFTPRSRPPLSRSHESRHTSSSRSLPRGFDSEPLSQPKLRRQDSTHSRDYMAEPVYATYRAPSYAQDAYDAVSRDAPSYAAEHRSTSYAFSPRYTRA